VVQPAVPLQGDDDDRSTTSNVSLHQDPEEDHVDPSAGHGNGEEQGSDFGDPSDDDSDLDGDEEEVHGNASAKNQIAVLKRQKAALEEAQVAAIAQATATEKQQKKEILLKIERVVKKQVWRSCKFITNNKDLDHATIFVFTTLDDKVRFKDWSPKKKADMVLTYRKRVSSFLNAKRNYAQSQSRDAVIRYATFKMDSKGSTVSGKDRVPDDTQDENTPPSEIRWVRRAPPDLFQDRLIVRAATR
jgi:hypothetical protein